MNRHLVIDFSSRNIFALIADEKGRAFPCTYTIRGTTSRYFFSDVCVDSKSYQEDQLSEFNKIINQSKSDFFFPGESLGWHRPYEISGEDETIVINPLYTFSLQGIMEDSGDLSMSFIFSAILVFLLQPVLRAVQNQGFHPRDLNVITVVPAYLSRPVRVILCSVLKRRMGFQKVSIMHHEDALAMHFLQHPFPKKIGVLHADDNCLHISRASMIMQNQNISVEYEKSCSVKELGWDSVISKIAMVLHGNGLLPDMNKQVIPYLNKALVGLFTGAFSTEIPTDPPFRLTYGLLEKALDQDTRDELSAELKLVRNELKDRDSHIVTSGSFFMIGGFENLVLDMSGKKQPPNVQRMLAMERAAYGVVHMLNWLYANQPCNIIIQNNYSIQTAGQNSAIELVPAHVLPEPGTKRTVRQVLGLKAANGMKKDMLGVDILWGNNQDSKYNMMLSSFAFEVTADDIRNGNLLELIFDLRGTSQGIKGRVTAIMEGHEPREEKLHFPSLNNVFM